MKIGAGQPRGHIVCTGVVTITRWKGVKGRSVNAQKCTRGVTSVTDVERKGVARVVSDQDRLDPARDSLLERGALLTRVPLEDLLCRETRVGLLLALPNVGS